MSLCNLAWVLLGAGLTYLVVAAISKMNSQLDENEKKMRRY